MTPLIYRLRAWLLLAPLGLAAAGAAAPPPSLLAAAANLRSGDLAERVAARDAIAGRLRGAPAPAESEALTALVPELLEIARIEEKVYSMASPPLLAIGLLGDLRAAEAVPLLLDRIGDEFPRFVVRDVDRLTPAAQALARIGPPAIEPILDRAGAADDEEWGMLAASLRTMEDREAVRAAVERRLAAGEPTDPATERLRALPR